jgi:hypothetical protein
MAAAGVVMVMMERGTGVAIADRSMSFLGVLEFQLGSQLGVEGGVSY